MGNCLKKESDAEWGGEEWEFLNSKTSKQGRPATSETESRRPRGSDYNRSKKVHFAAHMEVFGGGQYEDELMKEISTKGGGMEQVRIRISKKQLEELLRKVEVQGLSVHEMMTCLINNGVHQDDNNDEHRAWRPVLKTIPELQTLS